VARFERKAIIDRLQQMKRDRVPIIGGGAGTGLSAKCEEQGGIDLIVIYNSGRYRMAGRGSLSGLMAYGNANDVVMEMAHEILPVVKNTPVLAGVNGTDPFCIFDKFLGDLKDLGFAGVQNFPTVGLIDGTFRANLEETGMSYGLEVDMIAAAHQLDMLTTPYVFCEDDATAMARAGADIIVCHLGLTTGGSIGAETRRLPGDGRCLGGSRAEGQQGCDGAGSWRPGVVAGRRLFRAQPHQQLPWFLWRIIDGAAADGAGADGTNTQIQGGHLLGNVPEAPEMKT
jgi:predicted TIM-barrel enzyme